MCVIIFKNLKIPTTQQTQSFQYKDKLVHAVRGSNGCLFVVRIFQLQYVGKMPRSSSVSSRWYTWSVNKVRELATVCLPWQH